MAFTTITMVASEFQIALSSVWSSGVWCGAQCALTPSLLLVAHFSRFLADTPAMSACRMPTLPVDMVAGEDTVVILLITAIIMVVSFDAWWRGLP